MTLLRRLHAPIWEGVYMTPKADAPIPDQAVGADVDSNVMCRRLQS